MNLEQKHTAVVRCWIHENGLFAIFPDPIISMIARFSKNLMTFQTYEKYKKAITFERENTEIHRDIVQNDAQSIIGAIGISKEELKPMKVRNFRNCNNVKMFQIEILKFSEPRNDDWGLQIGVTTMDPTHDKACHLICDYGCSHNQNKQDTTFFIVFFLS